MHRTFAGLVVIGIIGWQLSAASAQDESELPKPIATCKAWYVAENGNDGGAGSKVKPWKTIARAGRTDRPGDVVYVQPGHYEGAILKMVGTKQAPITYISVERHKAIIDKGGFQGAKGTFGHRVQVDGSYSIFDGFACSTGWDPTKADDRKTESRNAPQAGIASYSSTGVILRNNNNVIVNNLFILENNSRGAILTLECGTNWIFNNIFWSVGGAPVFNDEGMTLGKQKTGSNASNSAIDGENSLTLSGDLNDLFENPDEKNFKLKPGASVIDIGILEFDGKQAPETDRAGVKRPQGAGIDIGPYEYRSE